MNQVHFNALREFDPGKGRRGKQFSLPTLLDVLPLQFAGDDSILTPVTRGYEAFDIPGSENMEPQQHSTIMINRRDGAGREVDLPARIDTAIESDYYRHGWKER